MNNAQTAEIIKKLCKERNITINTLLTDCGVRKGLIYDLEKRDKTPSPDILECIADYLHCSVDYLLGRDEKKPTPEDGDGLDEGALEQEFMRWFRMQPLDRQKEILFDLAQAVPGPGQGE